MSGDNRGPWYLLTGLILGILLGLAYAWLMQPVEYVDTSPASLRSDFKDQYRALIASAYLANGDLLRARARLELLEDEDVYRLLSEQAQRMLAQDSLSSEARALGLLAVALGQQAPGPGRAITQPPHTATATLPSSTASPTAALTDTHTPAPSSTPTRTPSPATDTPGVTLTSASAATQAVSPSPSPTEAQATDSSAAVPSGPFVLSSRQQICDEELEQPLIQVEATSLFGQPVPGVLVVISWDAGEERFFTGLKPEKGLGYADFTPLPGKIYTLRLGEGGQPVSGLTAVECPRPEGGTFWGAWKLKFVQP